MRVLRILTLGILVILLSSETASAQYNISKRQAESFYQQCMDDPHPIKEPLTKKYFCSCSSVRFSQQLSRREADMMKFPSTVQGKRAHEKLLMYVYGPCMQEPLKDILNYECISTSYLDALPEIDKNTYCACQNYRLPKLIQHSSSRIIREEMRSADDIITDPISQYLKNDFFLKRSERISEICYNYSLLSNKKVQPLNQQRPRIFLRNNTRSNRGNAIAQMVIAPQSSIVKPSENVIGRDAQ